MSDEEFGAPARSGRAGRGSDFRGASSHDDQHERGFVIGILLLPTTGMTRRQRSGHSRRMSGCGNTNPTSHDPKGVPSFLGL